MHSLPLLYRECYDCEFVFDPIQDRSRAAKYQVSPDMQHVLFAFEVKPVRNPPSATQRTVSFCLKVFFFLTVMLFVSADLPVLLCGQVHYLQPCDTVRPTSVLPSSHCLFRFRLFLPQICEWAIICPQLDLMQGVH